MMAESRFDKRFPGQFETPDEGSLNGQEAAGTCASSLRKEFRCDAITSTESG